MKARVFLAAIGLLALGLSTTAVTADEPGALRSRLLAQAVGNIPKGSYQQSCQCQISGGVTLMCFCANLNGRLFQTTLDVRNCTPPKDIRNCNGNLKCIEKGQEC